MSTTPGPGSASASAAMDGSDDAWALAKARFLSDLDPSEQELFNNATLENLYYTTSNANRDDAEKSRVRAVATKLGPLVSAVECYGKALDTFAQIAPLYLSPIWGSIRVLLVLARSYGKFFERIVDTLGRIGDVMPRFRDYERIYGREKHQRLTQALSNAYLDIIVLCTQFRKSIREQKSSSFRRLLKPLSLDRQFDEAVERFREHKSNVEEEARLCHMIEAAEKRREEMTIFAVERKRRLLSRLSTVGFEYKHRKLRALRHIGTGAWLLADSQYNQWYTSTQSSVMCCYGIPGCGKSVLSSSIVDFLGSKHNVIYYYCDYADKRTLDPANVFGTMARQVLAWMDHITEPLATAIEDAAHDGDRLADYSQALAILQECIAIYNKPVYISIDGLDEMTEDSQKTTCHGLSRLVGDNTDSTKLFMTGREDLASLLRIKSKISYTLLPITASAITSDILLYVQASTQRRILEGSLVIQDPGLELVVIDTLVKGAHGMFLWVEFQLCDLCEAESDHGIMRALENLPKNLGETYDRLLAKITGDERRDMIVRMFKWLVCARRPLLVDEVKEAVAFTLEDDEWQREKLVTSVDRLIRACGNLVTIDDETKAVHFAHYTVQQYLLAPSTGFFHFTLKDANVMAGEFCIAYLNFTNFETQMTRFQANAYTDMTSLGMLASNGMLMSPKNPGQIIYQLWNDLRDTVTPREFNIARYAPERKMLKKDLSAFSALDYAIAHWHSHSMEFEVNPGPLLANAGHLARRDQLFKDLVLSKTLLFDFRPWGLFNDPADKLTSIALLGWALAENHGYLILLTRQNYSALKYMQPITLICAAWSTFVQNGISESKLRLLELHKSVPHPSSDDMHVWLISRAVLACQKSYIRVLKCCEFDGGEIDGELLQFLMLASAASAHLQIITFLADQVVGDEDLHRLWSDSSPWQNSLERAVLAGNCDATSYLLSKGYKAEALCPEVNTYLYLINVAIDDGLLGALQCLLMISDILYFSISGADISDLLVFTVKRGLRPAVAILLRSRTFRPFVTLDFQHALESSLQHDVDFQDSGSLLQLATTASIHGSPEMLDRLLVLWDILPSFWGDPEDLVESLLIAVRRGLQHVVKLLLDRGANPHKASQNGSLALIEAIGSSNRECLFTLLQYRCSLRSTPRGLPLSIAAAMGDLKTTKTLIAYGADLFGTLYTDPRSARLLHIHQYPFTDKMFQITFSPTPLYMACYHGHRDIVELLLLHGASADLVSPADLFAVTVFHDDSSLTKCSRRHICSDGNVSGSLGVPAYNVVPEWKYPIAAAIDQGHGHIVALLTSRASLNGSAITHDKCIDRQHTRHDIPHCSAQKQRLIQETILKNAFAQLPQDDEHREQMLCDLVCWTNHCKFC